MDTLPTADRWPKHPYRGLDFYGESEARLFRERDAEIRECAAILLGFGVKILLLQGSGGSGKSSFLRAGLIPYLRRSEPRNFLLNGKDSVVRCTSDPLPEIARSLVDAFDSSESSPEPVRGGIGSDGEVVVEKAVCSEVRRSVTQAISGPRDQLANALASALLAICRELPGKLILVLDQAEEVLTRAPSGGAGASFFRFLEEIYLRNIDARLVVALRTEHYGRFRDELRISDDRLGNRPRSGGVEPYLLRPLREKNALFRIVEAPALATAEDGASVYKFEFESGLVARIVGDLLETFPHASVTPALQVVCSTLYGEPTGRDRTITHAHYARLGTNVGIFGEYIQRGITAAGPRSKVQLEQWRALLYSLVSRQDGDTVVSLIEPLEELESRARDLGIGGAIGPVLAKMTGGSAPLLRGEPPEDPRNFSLKHDVLAVVLARWYAEHAGAVKAKKEAKRWSLAAGLGALVIGLFLGSMIWQRAEQAFQAKIRAITLTNKHATHAPDGNFRLSLLLTLANLDGTERPDDFYEWITGGDKQIHAETFAEFRKALSRAPWFAGRYRAAGLDGSANRMALLSQNLQALQVITLPAEGGEAAEPEVRNYELPAPIARVSIAAAGFVSSLGPAALVNGRVSFWNERSEMQSCNLISGLPPGITSGDWIRAQFAGGRLQIATAERHELKFSLRVIQLDAFDLQACSSGTVVPAEVLRLPERPFSQPVPVFSEAPDLSLSYQYLEETTEPVPDELRANLPIDPSRADQGSLVELDAVIGLAEQDRLARIAVGQVSPERAIPERLHYSIASVANAQAILFKFDGPDFYVYDLRKSWPSSRRPGYLDITPQHVAVTSDLAGEAWRLQPAGVPMAYPPFAAAKIGQHWRAAWLAGNGVWAVESSERDPGTATPIQDAPLMGEPDGANLQFTWDGQFLALQRVQLHSPVSVRIWDLRPSWRAWIQDPNTTEQELRKVACRIVRMDGTGGAFDETDMEIFQIDPVHREPCPDPQGSK